MAKKSEKKDTVKSKKSKKKTTKTTKSKKQDENKVFVGNKPVMNYVLAVVTQFNNGEKTVDIEARGRAISRAVDVAEIARNRFLEDLKLKGIDIGTEKLKGNENEPVNVSTIKISLKK